MPTPLPAADELALHAYFNYALTGILETDNDGTIRRANPAAASITGVDAKQLQGRRLNDLASASARQRLARHWSTLWEQGISQVTWQMPGASGAEHILEMASVQISEARYLHVFDDVSAREHAMAAAEHARREAEAASKAKSDFLANVSHEMRTPLNAIIGFSQLLLQGSITPAQRPNIEHIERAGQALLTLVNALLDGARIESGQIAIEHTPFSMHEVLSGLMPLCRQAQRDKGLAVRIQVAPDVPRRCLGDPQRINQCLRNLLDNAIKFTPAGRVQLHITRRRHVGGEQLWLEVSDTGIGIAPATLDKMCEPFAMGDSSSARRYGGLGLGLYLTRELAHRMGGELRATSTPGAGSSFTLIVPLLPLDHLSPPSSPAPQDATPMSQEFRGYRVLVAEDNPVNQLVIGQWLTRAGMEPLFADDGHAVLGQMAQDSNPDLILMDIQMPGMDGIAACRQLRAQGRTLPIIGLSAAASADDQQACLESGMNDFLPKPLDQDELWGCLTRWLAPQTGGVAAAIPDARPDPASGPDAAALLLAAFSVHHGADAQRLQSSLQAGDRHAMRRVLHSLKGAAGTVGATALAAHARQMEEALNGNAGDARLHALLEQLDTLLRAVPDRQSAA